MTDDQSEHEPTYTQITDDTFEAAVRAIADENPDTVYKWQNAGCVYVQGEGENRCGSCLIGQGLIRAGVPIEEVAALDALSDSNARYVLDRFGVSKPVAVWADRAQSNQDSGFTFSDAVGYADEESGK